MCRKRKGGGGKEKKRREKEKGERERVGRGKEGAGARAGIVYQIDDHRIQSAQPSPTHNHWQGKAAGKAAAALPGFTLHNLLRWPQRWAAGGPQREGDSDGEGVALRLHYYRQVRRKLKMIMLAGATRTVGQNDSKSEGEESYRTEKR